MAEKAIVLEHVGMRFSLSKEKTDTLKDFVFHIFRRKKEKENNVFWALKDISFEVEKGDRVGILGLNGAGKSTLLKVISGVFKPTEGTVEHSGKIAPLLELGAGFDHEYTGAENIYLNGAVLGYTRKFIDEKFDEIVEFSELGDFIEVPVKNYSSGMRTRLGFSIATVVEPQILILDEVLSVGDAHFREKSENKILSMFDTGVTVLFVSHNLNQVMRLCNKALILDHGRLVTYGDIEEVAPIYEEMSGTPANANKNPSDGGTSEKAKKKKKRIRRQRRKIQRMQEETEQLERELRKAQGLSDDEDPRHGDSEKDVREG